MDSAFEKGECLRYLLMFDSRMIVSFTGKMLAMGRFRTPGEDPARFHRR
jgi:hypothetical protein